MITLDIRNSIGTVGFYNYSFDTSSLEAEGVTYAEYDGETGFYEREPFVGRETDSDIMALVAQAASEVEAAREAAMNPPPPSLEQLRTMKMAEINSAYQADMDQILDKYPNAETLTFDKQDREARDWQAWVDGGSQGDAPATPLISNLAEGRQMPKEELVSRIIAKSDAWLQMSGHATGKRQYLEDRVMAAMTPEELEAINW